MFKTALTRKSRRHLVAEALGADISDIREYQSTQKARENRLPIFDCGYLVFCILPTDSAEKVERTKEGREWQIRSYWRDASISICMEETTNV